MNQPYLFRFKKSCSTRFNVTNNVFFDKKMDMVFVRENGIILPAIDSNCNDLPTTKKADIETGEDQKDSMMWK